MRRIAALAVFLIGFSFSAESRADLMISFSITGAPFAVTVNPGAEVALPVYILQSPPTDNDGALLAVDGLISAGVQLDYAAVGGGQKAIVTSVTLSSLWNLVDPLFTWSKWDNPNGVAVMVGSTTFGSVVITNPILIGEVTFKAGSDPGVMTVISSGDYKWKDFDPYLESVILAGNGQSLDAKVFGSDNSKHTLGTITTVPEPSTLALILGGIGMGGAIPLLRRIRRRP